MEFYQGRGRCSENEEVDMIGDMDKVPYSSSSSSSSQYRGSSKQFNARWGGQFYHQSGACEGVTNLQHKNEDKRGVGESGSGSGSGGGGGDRDGAGDGAGDNVVCIEREHMFDKVVTPSDVGKLNRLVIPKQHAEKYFPLDSTANEKGLLLNFEDRCGKPWRFRYSYWNSSQSYVMTKGWSRFVKEKKLYAGDIVSFERGAGESVKDRLYIDWRRRTDAQDPGTLPPLPLLHPLSLPRSAPWGGLIMPPNMGVPMPRDHMVWQRMNYTHMHDQYHQRTNYTPNAYNVVNSASGPVFYLRSSSAAQQMGVVQQGGDDAPVVFNSVPVVHGKASAKRLRLFGVNLDCPTPENPEYQFMDSTSLSPPTMDSVNHNIPPTLQLSLYNNESPPTEPSDSPNDHPSMSLDLDM